VEREHIDKVRPVRLFVLFGLLLDPWFTIRFLFLSFYYFMNTRILPNARSGLRWKEFIGLIKQESTAFQDLEAPARALLNEKPALRTIVFGHTHRPMNRIYPDGKQYLNTGTWTKMVNLDWRGLGQEFRLTFALIKMSESGAKSDCELHHWVGQVGPYRRFTA
jgi:UDP-2,3-diacylglucosamine pyrophosphatase LpxH